MSLPPISRLEYLLQRWEDASASEGELHDLVKLMESPENRRAVVDHLCFDETVTRYFADGHTGRQADAAFPDDPSLSTEVPLFLESLTDRVVRPAAMAASQRVRPTQVRPAQVRPARFRPAAFHRVTRSVGLLAVAASVLLLLTLSVRWLLTEHRPVPAHAAKPARPPHPASSPFAGSRAAGPADSFLGPLSDRLARVVELAGRVEVVNEAGTSQRALVGQVIEPGQTLRTRDDGSFAALEYSDTTRLELSADTAVQFPSHVARDAATSESADRAAPVEGKEFVFAGGFTSGGRCAAAGGSADARVQSANAGSREGDALCAFVIGPGGNSDRSRIRPARSGA